MSACDSNHQHHSPSLTTRGDRDGQAFELKFVLEEPCAAAVEHWAQRHLIFDPHGDPALGGSYHTTTLYFDTPQLDVYYRSPSYGRRKYRVRRYGMTSWVFLERKSKSGDRVSKRRTKVAEQDVAMLADPMSLETWPGHWFRQRIALKGLRPAARITYRRTAYVGSCNDGPLRITLDRDLHGALGADWRLLPSSKGLSMLPDRVILELKFRGALPQPFKVLVREFRLNPSVVSKYRLCREAWGLPSVHGEAARA